MTFPAPGLFSMITLWPNVTESLFAISRAITSGLAPADCDTMNVTGRCGQVSAHAGCMRPAVMNKAARERISASERDLATAIAQPMAGKSATDMQAWGVYS